MLELHSCQRAQDRKPPTLLVANLREMLLLDTRGHGTANRPRCLPRCFERCFCWTPTNKCSCGRLILCSAMRRWFISAMPKKRLVAGSAEAAHSGAAHLPEGKGPQATHAPHRKASRDAVAGHRQTNTTVAAAVQSSALHHVPW
jgi:hypothetical protein